MVLAAVLVGFALDIAAGPTWSVHAVPQDCPPICDRIPDSAWITPTAIPLYDVYRWPGLPLRHPATPGDARGYAVAARAVAPNPQGHWQLHGQVIHWRGETWRGGPTAMAIFDAAVAALRACQLTSPSISTREADRLAVGARHAGLGRVGRPAVQRLPRLVPVEFGASKSDVEIEEPWVARVIVNVMPKAEILDPQGQAIVGALGRLGVSGVSDVRQGKRFELEVDDSVDDATVAEIAESLLANTVIEDWSVSREPA
jgi:phosphoribosylformylglycinamidine synthase PurS subunit